MNSDGDSRPQRIRIFVADVPPADIYFGKKKELVWVKCSTPHCDTRIKVKKEKTKWKRKLRCTACERKIALDSATQDKVSAECAKRNRLARERRLKVLQDKAQLTV